MPEQLVLTERRGGVLLTVSDKEFAVGKDYHRRDAFYRFNQTFQEYFDACAAVEALREAAAAARA